MQLTRFDRARFLSQTWQREPLLIRNPWAEWHNPLEPDELAGLACEDAVEARLIAGTDLHAEHGPFPETRFARLDKAPWTLLVQAVDQHVPEVAAMLSAFRFIPDWRIDDVMVSYASDGGGVGPHFDHYDVFLIQGLGRRRWQVGRRCDDDTPLRPHDDLRLLAEFEPEAEWVLEPGDMLYVPPGFAHNGVAIGDDCMTYSIGFRAPSRGDLIGGWCDDLAMTLREDDRYADPALALPANPGEISQDALDRLHAMVTETLADRAAFAQWFGAVNSTRKYPEIDWRPEVPFDAATLRAELAGGAALVRNPASRFAFIREGEGRLTLFVDGERFSCADEVAKMAERLCADQHYQGDGASDDAMALLVALANQGSLELT